MTVYEFIEETRREWIYFVDWLIWNTSNEWLKDNYLIFYNDIESKLKEMRKINRSEKLTRAEKMNTLEDIREAIRDKLQEIKELVRKEFDNGTYH